MKNIAYNIYIIDANREIDLVYNDVKNTLSDIKNIKNDYGYCPKTSVNHGIKKFISWYQSKLGISDYWLLWVCFFKGVLSICFLNCTKLWFLLISVGPGDIPLTLIFGAKERDKLLVNANNPDLLTV